MHIDQDGLGTNHNKSCLVQECQRKPHARGYCTRHYNKWYAHGDPLYPDPPQLSDEEKRAHIRASKHRYKQTHKGKLAEQKYKRGERGRAANKRYLRTEKRKLVLDRYYKSPKGISTRAKWIEIRRNNIRQATPAWVDSKKITEIYKNCPIGFHVDHIIPLQNNIVCGLHVPWNLNYLPARINIEKSNKLEEIKCT